MLADFFLCVWCRVRCGSIVLGCFSSLNQQKGKTFSFSSQDTDTSDIFSFSIFKREEIESERSLGNMSVSLTTTVAFFSCMKISIGVLFLAGAVKGLVNAHVERRVLEPLFCICSFLNTAMPVDHEGSRFARVRSGEARLVAKVKSVVRDRSY